jgi:hypothetical protein
MMVNAGIAVEHGNPRDFKNSSTLAGPFRD